MYLEGGVGSFSTGPDSISLSLKLNMQTMRKSQGCQVLVAYGAVSKVAGHLRYVWQLEEASLTFPARPWNRSGQQRLHQKTGALQASLPLRQQFFLNKYT
eukprot:scaffold126041_cov15-Tisochrysis_lutea.AAC.3